MNKTDVVDLTGDNDRRKNPRIVHTISDDEEDDDLKLTIALSLQNEEQKSMLQSEGNDHPPESELLLTRNDYPQNKASTFLGLDRKAMELERLARLKRKREESDDGPAATTRQKSTSAVKSTSHPPQTQEKPEASLTTASTPSLVAGPISTLMAPQSPTFSFPEAKVLLTASPSRYSSIDNTLEAISFEDILKPPHLASTANSPSPTYRLNAALLSSYVADLDWLFPHFKLSGPNAVRFVLVLHAQDTAHRQALLNDFEGIKSIRLVMPSVQGGGYSKMHSKLMLLFYTPTTREGSLSSEKPGEICRIVVPSANLTPYDWGVNGVMENILYIIDLPSKPEERPVNAANLEETMFEKRIRQQLNAMGVPSDVMRRLDSFDLSATRNTGFIHSVSVSESLHPNPSVPNSIDRVSPASIGLVALSETIKSLGLAVPRESPSYPPQLDIVTSSIGNMNFSFLQTLYQATCGTLDPDRTPSTTGKRKRKKKPENTRPGKGDSDNEDDDTAAVTHAPIKGNIRVYFPSAKTVQQSKGGPASAGTICFQKKWWGNNELIQDLLRDCIGVRRDGILMHSKIMYTTFKQPLSVKVGNGERKCLGWAYVGSANLSESAWGKPSRASDKQLPKINCRNWESGVVVPVFAFNTDNARDNGRRPKASTFGNGVNESKVDGAKDRRTVQGSKMSHKASQDMASVFAGKIPIPFQIPAPKHTDMGLEPWFFQM